MKLAEIEKKLDLRCLLALREEGPATGYLKRSVERFPVYIFREDGAIFANMLIPRAEDEDQKRQLFLRNYEAVEKKNYYVITQRINNLPQLRACREIFDVPSVALNSEYFEGDTLYMDFRFHHNFAPAISRLLSKFSENYEDARVVDLGPTPGLRIMMNRINQSIPLSVIKYRVPVQGKDSSLKKMLYDVDMIAEVERTRSAGEQHTYLLYRTEATRYVDNDVTEVAHDDFIYEVSDVNPYLLDVSKMANDERIPRYALFVRRFEDEIETIIFLPSSQRDPYSKILFDLGKKYFDSPPILTVSREYSEGLWEYL